MEYIIKVFYPLCGIFYKQYICDQLSGFTRDGGSCPLPAPCFVHTRPAETLFADNTLQQKPKLFNVLDYINIHDYVGPSLLLLLLSLATVLHLHDCRVTAWLVMLLLYTYSCVAVTATHTNAKVSCDVTACCDVTCYSTNNHLLMIISIIFKNRRYHMYFGFVSFVLSNCTPYL